MDLKKIFPWFRLNEQSNDYTKVYSACCAAMLDTSTQLQLKAPTKTPATVTKAEIHTINGIAGISDKLPEIKTLETFGENPPELKEEVIEGVLRKGHKLMISAQSKAGKSFALMELAVALATGGNWLKFKCHKCRVLYINLEIDEASAINRFMMIYEALKLPPDSMKDILLWNLRGFSTPLEQLNTELIPRVRDLGIDVIILDPIYKIFQGSENDSDAASKFCIQVDVICNELGCSAVYSHHHSKGPQAQKASMDRASGSGVFARDVDALLDLIPIAIPKGRITLENGKVVNPEEILPEGATAWHIESTLREFPDIEPFNLFFECPVHVLDEYGILSNSYQSSGHSQESLRETHKKNLNKAYEACVGKFQPVKISDMADFLRCSERSVREWIKEDSDDYMNSAGVVTRISAAKTDHDICS